VYNSQVKKVQVNTIRRKGHNYGEAFSPGNSISMSWGTENKIESMRRSLLHEVAHHQHEAGGDEIEEIGRVAFTDNRSRPITRYARSRWDEYIAETWVAHNVERKTLEEFDPVGCQMIENILEALKECPR
jgi:hypothetical protein